MVRFRRRSPREHSTATAHAGQRSDARERSLGNQTHSRRAAAAPQPHASVSSRWSRAERARRVGAEGGGERLELALDGLVGDGRLRLRLMAGLPGLPCRRRASGVQLGHATHRDLSIAPAGPIDLDTARPAEPRQAARPPHGESPARHGPLPRTPQTSCQSDRSARGSGSERRVAGTHHASGHGTTPVAIGALGHAWAVASLTARAAWPRGHVRIDAGVRQVPGLRNKYVDMSAGPTWHASPPLRSRSTTCDTGCRWHGWRMRAL